VILSSSRTSRLTVAVSARVSPAALAELHESGSAEGKQLNIRRSMTFPHGHQTHIEGCSTTASTSSSPSAHTSRIRHLYNSNDVEMSIEQLDPSVTSAMSEVVHDANPVSTSTPSITPVTPDQPGGWNNPNSGSFGFVCGVIDVNEDGRVHRSKLLIGDKKFKSAVDEQLRPSRELSRMFNRISQDIRAPAKKKAGVRDPPLPASHVGSVLMLFLPPTGKVLACVLAGSSVKEGFHDRMSPELKDQ
ncbi:hypothetical protein FOZ62_024653, partial [Perkinsus olseni]